MKKNNLRQLAILSAALLLGVVTPLNSIQVFAQNDTENELNNYYTRQNNIKSDISKTEAEIIQVQSDVNKAQNQLSGLNADLAKIQNEIKLQESTTGNTQTTYIYRYPEVTKASEGNTMIGVTGEFYQVDKIAVLNRLNEIRQEAVRLGYVDRYVPLKWSRALEDIAKTRSVEAMLTLDHSRLSEKVIWTTGSYFNGENLAWHNNNGTSSFITAVNNWYSEKKNYYEKEVLTGQFTPYSGHYRAMIDPNYKFTALGSFDIEPGKWTTTAQSLSESDELTDESLSTDIGKTIQWLEATSSDLSNYQIITGSEIKYPTQIDISATLVSSQADFDWIKKYGTLAYPTPTVLIKGDSNVSWQTNNKLVATIDDKGVLTPVSNGQVVVSATVNGKTLNKSFNITKVVSLEELRKQLATTQNNINQLNTTLSLYKQILTQKTSDLSAKKAELENLNLLISKALAEKEIQLQVEEQINAIRKNSQLSDSQKNAFINKINEIQQKTLVLINVAKTNDEINTIKTKGIEDIKKVQNPVSMWVLNELTKKWAYFDANGNKVSSRWIGDYYLKPNTEMADKEWIYDNNYQAWYYLREGGSYARSQWIGDYYLKADGKMADKEWVYDNFYNSYYYLREGGSYARNQWIGNYYLKANGMMAKSEWIYDNYYQAWYYLRADGSYARNEWVGNYYLQANGKMR